MCQGRSRRRGQHRNIIIGGITRPPENIIVINLVDPGFSLVGCYPLFAETSDDRRGGRRNLMKNVILDLKNLLGLLEWREIAKAPIIDGKSGGRKALGGREATTMLLMLLLGRRINKSLIGFAYRRYS